MIIQSENLTGSENLAQNSSKKKYEAPRLTEFGTVRQTTLGSSGSKGDGRGSRRTAGMGMGMGMGRGILG